MCSHSREKMKGIFCVFFSLFVGHLNKMIFHQSFKNKTIELIVYFKVVYLKSTNNCIFGSGVLYYK